ncbi:MAG: mannose-1-phosphate guanylyltransferase/mannose-6-phosphate isomerase [Gammaproteobacteria bacterium]|nr:mannose-1-phosphate guanylyltransferase/mannose-6-phosphate isomerase [Gammaproteobacteria bacterium]
MESKTIFSNVKAVILAGGSGSRLWPHSREHLPKQFLNLAGDKSLLASTVERLQPYLDKEDVLIVTNDQQASGEAYQLLSAYQTLLEPVGRNTAAAIGLAALFLRQQESECDPVMLVLPADHLIQNVSAFHAVLKKSVLAAKEGALVTFGIQPSRADSGFGYIKARASESKDGRCSVVKFVEKPDAKTAQRYLDEGDYFWNSGMFVWKASSILAQIECHLPDLFAVLEKIEAAWKAGVEHQQAISDLFPSMPNISIDCGVLEKVIAAGTPLLVFPCDLAWSDVGSWDAVHEMLPKDEANNVLVGNAVALGCKNSLIHSSHRLVAAVGVEDLCVVETADALLISKRGETQRVREVVDELKRRNAQEQRLHLTVRRPWGEYTVLEQRLGFKMKRITVDEGASISLQRHQHRSEHWVVVSGTATVTCDDEVKIVTCNQSTYIPVGSKHRLDNRGKIPLQLIEIQVGEYLEEDDIERFDDLYGR